MTFKMKKCLQNFSSDYSLKVKHLEAKINANFSEIQGFNKRFILDSGKISLSRVLYYPPEIFQYSANYNTIYIKFLELTYFKLSKFNLK